MEKEYKDKIIELLDEDLDIEYIISDLYEDDLNWNNTDRTSQQCVRTRDDIRSDVESVLDDLREESERCSNCGRKYESDGYRTSHELRVSDPYPMYEDVVVAYECPHCGEVENF